jgi:hypothetical protein
MVILYLEKEELEALNSIMRLASNNYNGIDCVPLKTKLSEAIIKETLNDKEKENGKHD